jgi:tetratricopeptide (TPR) repeat protein
MSRRGRSVQVTESEGGVSLSWGILVFALAVLAYLPALLNGLVWDDHQLLASDLVTGHRPWWMAFTSDYWNLGKVWSDSAGYYRPLTVLSLRLDHALGGGSALAYHITAILLHGLTSAAVLPLALRFGAPKPAAQFASLLFAVNPHSAETIAWVSGRPDLLMATALLWALVLPQRWSLLLGACALLSKETAVVWPVLAAIRDRRLITKARVGEAALVAVYLAVRALVLQDNAVRLFSLDASAGLRAFLLLLGTWIVPFLTPPAFTPILSWAEAPVVVLIGAMVAALLAVLAFVCGSSRRPLLAWATIHAPAALLMSSTAVLGMRPMYAAAAFLSIAVCCPFASRLAPLALGAAKLPVAALFVALSIWCGMFSRRWSDDLSFQALAAVSSPNSVRVRLNLSVAQRDSGRLNEAWQTTTAALALGPSEGVALVRGQLLEAAGCPANALEEYQRSAAISPSFPLAQASIRQLLQANPALAPGNQRPATTPAQLRCSEAELTAIFADAPRLTREGSRLIRMQRLDLAQIALTAALHAGNPTPALNLANAQLLYLQGKPSEAISFARAVLAAEPTAAPAMKILGLALLDSGQNPAEGRAFLKQYLQASPTAPDRAYLSERLR